MTGVGEPERWPGDERGWLEDGEEVVAMLEGDGARVFATSRRVVLVRDGSKFRPRSGVRSWPFDRVRGVSLVEPKRGQARIIVRTDDPPPGTVSMFFEARRWPDAERLVHEIRMRRTDPRSAGRGRSS